MPQPIPAKPMYQKIRERLERDISGGRYAAGEKFPREAALGGRVGAGRGPGGGWGGGAPGAGGGARAAGARSAGPRGGLGNVRTRHGAASQGGPAVRAGDSESGRDRDLRADLPGHRGGAGGTR